jgi:transcriptional regulator NrdR family protein
LKFTAHFEWGVGASTVEHNLEALEDRVLRTVIQSAQKRRSVTEKTINEIIRNITTLLFTGYH